MPIFFEICFHIQIPRFYVYSLSCAHFFFFPWLVFFCLRIFHKLSIVSLIASYFVMNLVTLNVIIRICCRERLHRVRFNFLSESSYKVTVMFVCLSAVRKSTQLGAWHCKSIEWCIRGFKEQSHFSHYLSGLSYSKHG